MVVVRCPTGCGPLRRPYALRAQAVRCANCTAWFAATLAAEDGSLCDGVLLARPGEPLVARRPPPRAARAWLVAIAVAIAAAAGLAGWAASHSLRGQHVSVHTPFIALAPLLART